MVGPRRSFAGPSAEVSPVDSGPTVLRIALGGRLRRLREAAGITREAAGDAIRASDAKISRLELGRVGFKERDVADLLTLYGVSDPVVRDALLELGRRANQPGWWREYGEVVPTWFETYIGLEQAAASLRTYQAQFVPGLLQTEEYARAVMSLGSEVLGVAEVERRVQLRMDRQRLLTRPSPPVLWAVLDEGALRRPVGGTKVQLDQLRRLLELAEFPTVTLQVATYRSGGLAAAGGPFTILRFAEPDLPDVVYLEQLTSALYLDKRLDVEHYMKVMDVLAVQAEPPTATPGTLNRMIADL